MMAVTRPQSSDREDTYQVDRVREIRRLRRRVRIGAPDPSLTPVSGMVAVTELVKRLGMIECCRGGDRDR